MKLKWIRYRIEELKFLKSLKDMKILIKIKLPLAFSKFSRKTIKDAKLPKCLQIEPTNRCNLNCICCSRDRSDREKGFMDFNLFKKIIDEASDNRVLRILLFLHGEPMLHPKIIDMIKYIKSKGLGITLTTNGMLFDKEKIEGILNAGVDSSDYFLFSILGDSKRVHEKVMVGVNHEKVTQNIKDFLKLRKKIKINGPIIETVFYSMPENKHETELYIKRWQGIVDRIGPVENTSKQFSDFKTDKNNGHMRTKTCKNLWEMMTVYWNGDVTSCYADLDGKRNYGNLGLKSIREIWNNEELLNLKRKHKEKRFEELDLCSTCDWA